ncbi:MAG: hypothetical protein A2283_23585 [Lentisphaerae bacterium RIFOXYA12_FULL_48_11]|nr:MAG: hypothetical protein A2283_23585 [Lentisphaerae bacterium RIFOXYA12_FULL_48_11]
MLKGNTPSSSEVPRGKPWGIPPTKAGSAELRRSLDPSSSYTVFAAPVIPRAKVRGILAKASKTEKLGKLPIYLSVFAFPGAGQFVQRRWFPAILFSISFFICFTIIMTKVFKIWAGMVHSAIDGTAFESIHYSSILWPFVISIIIYIAGIIDTNSAHNKKCRTNAQKKLEDTLNKLSASIAISLFLSAVSVNAQNEEIFQAIRSNDVARMDQLIEQSGFTTVKMGTPDGITPLHFAAALNRYSPAALLISAGADVKAKTSGGFTPLHWAAGKDAMETARLLIKSGADINAKASSGITPLHWAANKNATNVLALLLAAGADPEARTDQGLTPLHWAAQTKSLEAGRWIAFKIASGIVDEENKTNNISMDVETFKDSPNIETPEPVQYLSGKTTTDIGKTLAVPIGPTETIYLIWIDSLKLWASKYETTNAQFKRFKSDHNSMFRESFKLNMPDQPAVYVSWNDAVDFCNWLNNISGRTIPTNFKFRLPTDKEWISMAQCGDSRIYPWGNEWPPKYGNFSDLTARKELSNWSGIRGYDDGFVASCPVSNSYPNEWNIFGLAGNVWEWCDDWFDSSNKYKVRHGGSWDFDDRKSLRIDYRGFDKPESKDDTIGFRVVLAREDSSKSAK